MLLTVGVSKNKDASVVNADETSISKHIVSMLSRKLRSFHQDMRQFYYFLFFYFYIFSHNLQVCCSTGK